MAVYTPESLGIKAPSGGFQELGWYSGRQYVGGTLSDPGTIHPSSSQVGAGQAVSEEVNRQSAAAQGVPYPQFTSYLEEQKKKSASVVPATPTPPTTQFNEAGAMASGATTGGEGIGLGAMAAPQTFDLQEMYKSLTHEAGIESLETELSTKEKEYIAAKAEINDNPFLSEATRVGRVAKLEQLYQERTANLRGDIATKKADIETQLNLQLKQFDINSQQTQLAWSQFNTLLQAGALDNATGEDIAAITRTTGIGSSMIQSAIQANKKKNQQVSLTQFDDGTNVYAIAMDEMGNVINRQLLGPSTKTSGGGTYTERYSAEVEQSAIADVRNGLNVESLARKYGNTLDDWKLINIYNQYSPYGSMKETPQQFSEWTGTTKATGELDEQTVNAWVSMVMSGQVSITNVPSEYRSEVTKRMNETSGGEEGGLNIWSRIQQIFGK